MTDVTDAYHKKKLAEAKAPLQKISPAFIEEMARVAHFGDVKHADTHWTLGLPWSETVGAIRRHISAFEQGEILDEESGYNHLIHAAVGLMFLHYYCNNPDQYLKNNDLIFFKKEKQVITSGD